VVRREKYSYEHIAGSLLMIIGVIVVLARDFTGIHSGDLFIACATFFSPIGNLFQQKARKFASSESIMFVRSILSIPALFACMVLTLPACTSMETGTGTVEISKQLKDEETGMALSRR